MAESVSSEENLDDDLRPEYDFAQMTGAVRGKYLERYEAGVEIFVNNTDGDAKGGPEH